MKYITLIIGLLVMGCGKNPVVGTYAGQDGGVTINGLAILGNGKFEFATTQWIIEGEWEVVGDELQLHPRNEGGMLLKIEGSRDLTWIANLSKKGKREDIPKEYQLTFKKIK